MEWLKDHQRVADRVDGLIERAQQGEIVLRMSRINLGEVFYSSYKEWGAQRAEEILGRMLRLPILYATASDEAVEAAARLKAGHRISYADAFAASLSMVYGCSLITGDPDFQSLASNGLLSVEWLGV